MGIFKRAMKLAGKAPAMREPAPITRVRTYKGKGITKLFPSGYYEVYSDLQGRFMKFDELAGAKNFIDDERRK